MRNSTLTIKGKFKWAVNILETNCGDYLIRNYHSWFTYKERYYVVLPMDESKQEWWIIAAYDV